MSYLIYILALAVVYLYTSARHSVGVLWALVFMLLQWGIASRSALDTVVSAALAGGAILIIFELVQALIGDPFSRARVFRIVSSLVALVATTLALFGIKPRSRLINVNDSAAVRQVYVQLQAERWDKVEALMRSMSDGARHHLIRGLAGTARRPAEFDQWMAERPMSAIACVVSGQQRLAAGWHCRGTGLDETVTLTRQQQFAAYLTRARTDFQRAMILGKGISDPHVGMLTVVMGSGGTRTELWDAFAKARIHADNHYQAHMAMVTALSPQWGGDPGEALAFGRITVRQAEPDSALVGVLAAAHIENWLELDSVEKDYESAMYFRQSPVVEELTHAYRRLDRYDALDADLVEALNTFAFCFYKGGQFELAQEIMLRLDERYHEYPWQYCTEPLLATFDIGFALDHVQVQLRRGSAVSEQVVQT